jgi:hypothetical protein
MIRYGIILYYMLLYYMVLYYMLLYYIILFPKEYCILIWNQQDQEVEQEIDGRMK